jgi:hypothetical protein
MAPKRKTSRDATAAPIKIETTGGSSSSTASPTGLTSGIYRLRSHHPSKKLKVEPVGLRLLRSLHPICEYPEQPHVYFRKKCKVDIDLATWASKQLRIVFRDRRADGVCYLPAPLIQLCADYATCTLKSVAQEVIDECNRFIEAEGIRGCLKSAPQLAASISDHVDKATIESFSLDIFGRALNYNFFFRVRQDVPECVDLNVSLQLISGRIDQVLASMDGEVAVSIWTTPDPPLCILNGHFMDWSQRIRVERIHAVPDLLLQSLPYLDLIAPCLNTSNCTKELVDKCVAEIVADEVQLGAGNSRSLTKTWREIITKVFIVLASTRQLINSCHEASERFVQMQPALKLEWNKIHEKYGFAEPFAL